MCPCNALRRLRRAGSFGAQCRRRGISMREPGQTGASPQKRKTGEYILRLTSHKSGEHSFKDDGNAANTRAWRPGQPHMKILIVVSSDHLAKFLTRALVEAGYILDRIDNGHDAFDFARGNACNAYDAILTDRILPGRIDGLGLVCELRKRGNKTAIVVMGRSSDIDDWALCLACGADDYLIKPFSFDSLLARLAAVLRYRIGRRNHQSALTVGALHLDFFTRRVVINGQPVALNPREFQLLEYLVRNANQIVTRTMLLEHVWQNDFVPRSNVVDAHISNLRRKLEGNSAKRILQTVRSEGYIFSTVS